ncbi:hypothetical protein [Paracoccus seriniphilus]|uniref:Uncharacterized protein n=1 Tax=Paracoccus seriniphilus TaxID=184748 RepID=A0A239PQH1_9RHOB|nr:hypothetical protein [Paracoccus seriniphilus]WCR13026.1 hypothetical protein JHW44_08680 [Paracoccus seriniphilus]SNT72534.1 hypothetical protein SAMN05444959_10331 [Paracoccus seriniphilus]
MRLFSLAVLLFPLPAMAFTAVNGMTARQISPTEIAVDNDLRRIETQYWCAAADFAQRVLGLPGKTRIWRATAKPRQAGEAIIFTLDPQNKAAKAGLSHFGSGPRDGSVSLAMAAQNYCLNEFPFFDR